MSPGVDAGAAAVLTLFVQPETASLDPGQTPVVGMGVTRIGYSDRDAFEVVEVHSPRLISIRPLHAERANGWKPNTVPGGFVGHTTNNYEQEWNLFSDPDRKAFKISLRKNGKWGVPGDRYATYKIGKAVYFYDYNF